MDKYEFNIKVEQIKKLVNKSDYETAMKIADTIDWRRVRNVSMLSMIATIYEKNEEYQEAKDILLLAFERAPIGKRLLYKLAELAVNEGNVGEAEDYYREFCDLAPDDPRQYLLRYMILGAKGAPAEQLIHTLEQYCNVELDEKWLYELATLYNQTGMDDLCVLACDKIMLMFGLGKYVDKAMELKIQHAPLTKYQMDLEENRDKYEERLRAVEQEYEVPAPSYGYDAPEPARPVPVRRPAAVQPEEAQTYEDIPVYGERQPYRPYRRPQEEEAEYGESYYDGDSQYREEEQYGEEYRDGEEYQDEEEPRYEGESRHGEGSQYEEEPRYEGESQHGEGSRYEDGPRYEEESQYGEESRYEEEPQYGDESQNGESSQYGETGRQDVTMEEDDREESPRQWEMDQHPMSEEALAARVHEAEVQANLARELSRLSGAEFSEESHQAQTRVLQDIRSLKINGNIEDETPVPSAQVSNHLMIEAEDPEEGLAMAVEALKQIHREMGIKNQAAKITGEKLNKKGVLALADKLTGRDLIIEYAGDMDDQTLQELDLLMSRDETGMNVVMIDNKEQLEAIHSEYPGLAKRFECIGETGGQEKPARETGYHTPEPREPESHEPEHRAPEYREPEYSAPEYREPEHRAPEHSAPESHEPEHRAPEYTVPEHTVPEHYAPESHVPESHAPEPRIPEAPRSRRAEPEYREDEYPEDEYLEDEYRDQDYDDPEHRAPEPPVPVRSPKKGKTKDKAPQAPMRILQDKAAAYMQDEEPEEDPEDGEELDIDEFAQYACQYAGEIDCSISGKSMLALYERIEIMEEDGMALTRTAAEDLIEDAADKAEKPSIGKRMKGLFSSKYDKNGLLILKEEHFI